MKKILSIVLCLVMLAVSAFAFAEETMVVYDPSVFELLGIEATTLSLEDFGLWVDIPSGMLPLEVAGEDAVAAFSTEDGSYIVSIGFAQVTDDAGNYFEDYDGLSTYYAGMGIEGMEIADVNNLYALTFVLPAYDTMTAAYLFDEGWVLAFNFSGASNEALAVISAAIVSSIRPAE